MHIRWTLNALNDLKAISGHIERRRNLVTANRVCRTIYDAIQMLRRFPESGKTGMEPDTRELVVPAFTLVHCGVSRRAIGSRSHPSYLARCAGAALEFAGRASTASRIREPQIAHYRYTDLFHANSGCQ